MTSQGYLYFDLNRGCTASMLISALASLGVTADELNDGLKKASLGEIKAVIEEVVRDGLKCQAVYFYLDKTLLTFPKKSPSFARPNVPFKPKWDAPLANEMSVMSPSSLHNVSSSSFINRCLGPDQVSLKEIEEFVRTAQCAPDVLGLSLQILSHLKSDLFVEQKMAGDEALWFTVHLLALSVGLRMLDPSFILATKIVTTRDLFRKDVKESMWLYETLKCLPVVESNESISIDVLAVAFIKTVAAQFGERGESTIVKIGLGAETSLNNHAHQITALLCEAVLPKTMIEPSQSDTCSSHRVFLVSALVPVTASVSILAENLEKLLAKEFHQHLVHKNNESLFSVHFIINEENKEAALKSLFSVGQVHNVTVKPATLYSLKERLVAVPIGYGNKQLSMRFMEYVLGQEVVKVDPVEEDLLSYIHQTDFSMDVARKDLLEAWKKWRLI